MSTNKISLKFYGRDFSPIDADLQDEVELVNGRKLNKSEQINLLIKFIDHHKADLKKLILQTSNKSDEDKIGLAKNSLALRNLILLPFFCSRNFSIFNLFGKTSKPLRFSILSSPITISQNSANTSKVSW